MIQEMSDADIDGVLEQEWFGHLACCENGTPYVIPLAYVFFENAFYGQTTEGRKADILRRHPTVCFQVERRRESVWESVLCDGTFEELDFSQAQLLAAEPALRRLSERLKSVQERVGITVPFTDAGALLPRSIEGRTAIFFRIRVNKRSGHRFSSDVSPQ